MYEALSLLVFLVGFFAADFAAFFTGMALYGNDPNLQWWQVLSIVLFCLIYLIPSFWLSLKLLNKGMS